jgi:hypothetical protein
VLLALLGAGLAVGACEPLDIALYPSAPDAGIQLPVDVSPPQDETPDAGSEPAPAPPDASSAREPCLPGATACEACVLAGNCPAGRVCHPLTGTCVVPCAGGASCPGSSVCNLLDEVCVECIDERQCPGPTASRCDTNRGICVECVTSDDCIAEPLARPACLAASSRCGCATNNDCPGGVCETSEAHCEFRDD